MSGQTFRWDIDSGRPAAIVFTPDGRTLPDWVVERLDVRPLETIPGAEYRPADMVQWIRVGESDA